MIKHRKRLRLDESSSISDRVKMLTYKICSKLKDDIFAKKNDKKVNKEGKFFFNSEFYIDTEPYLNGIGEILIKYKFYSFKDYDVYREHKNEVTDYTCECDFEKKFIRICSVIIGDGFPKDLYSDVQHEVNHLYQNYMGGGQKNESMYETCKKLMKSDDEIEKNIGMTMYYCFPHEQDSMTNQFYAYLMQNFKGENKINRFENAIRYSVYPDFRKYSSCIFDNDPDVYDKVDEIMMKNFSMKEKDFVRYIDTAEDRLYKKLIHGFMKYLEDVQNMDNKAQYEDVFGVGNEIRESIRCSRQFYNLLGFKVEDKLDFIYN